MTLSRRRFIQYGSLSVGLSALAPYRLTADGPPSDTAVILLWPPAAPPHMETYALKPDAPAEYRGAFKPIRTNVSGLDICEHLPMHARLAHRYSIIRSMHHK